MGRNLNQVLQEKADLINQNRERAQNQVLIEKELKTKGEEWQRIVDEMAHTIHTDIFIATDSLLELEDNQLRKKIFAHLVEVRDLTDLTLWFLKKDELVKKNDKVVSIDLKNIIENQITTIKKAPSTLRLSTKKHRENLSIIQVPVESTGITSIYIPSEIQKVFNLLFKDLLRNAFKNTTHEKPYVAIKFVEGSELLKVTITNNKLMPEEFASWLMTNSTIEPEIAKHSKAGLRILKKWFSYLNISIDVTLDKEDLMTAISILIPKTITLKEDMNGRHN